MRLAGEDGRDVPVQGLVVEGFASADLVGVAAEPGGEMVMHDLAPLRLGLQRCAAALPRGEQRGSKGKKTLRHRGINGGAPPRGEEAV